jgi:galacturan 1,4-alpha-galacturonidase
MNFSLIKFLAATLLAAAATTDASPMMRQEAEAGCTLSGTYSSSSGLSSCSNVVISNLKVPAGVTLDLTKLKAGATVTFSGTTTFGTKLWSGPLILLTGTNLKVTGTGTLDGQGAWYWKQGQSVTRPVFFRLNHVDKSTLSGFTLKNSPFRTFSILHSTSTTLTGLKLDSSAGNGLAKNTDGFDLSYNNGVTISNNIINNQDDCLAMQSSTNTVFSGNTCTGGHGISVGSIGGNAVDESDTVSGLTVTGNKIINSDNGLRIKTIIGLKGLVTNVKYINNQLTNVKNAIVMHSDYSKSKGGYTGSATSAVGITDITISGLSGTATNLYDVLANPSVVSGWKWSGITVKASKQGSCKGQPSAVVCA